MLEKKNKMMDILVLLSVQLNYIESSSERSKVRKLRMMKRRKREKV